MPPFEKKSASTPPPRLVHRQYVILGTVFVAILLGLTAYEIGNHGLFSGISLWQSHVITIVVGAVVATVAALIATRLRQSDAAQIDRLQQLEAALRYSEAQYRAIIEDQTDLICRYTPDGALTFVNKVYCQYLNMRPEELLGRSVFSLMLPDVQEAAKKHLAAVAQSKEPATTVDRLLSPGVENIWIQWTDSPLFDEQGRLTGFQAVGHNVTERVRAEQMLALQRDLAAALNSDQPLPQTMQAILDIMLCIEEIDSGGVYLADPRTGDLDLIAYTGLPPAFVKNAAHYSADTPQVKLVQAGQPLYTHYDAIGIVNDASRQNEGLQAIAVVPVMYEGKAVAALNLASHVYDEFPDYVRSMIATLAEQMGIGIARVRAEAALHASQKNLQALFNTINDFLFILDEQGRIIHVNPVVEQRLGYTFDELNGRSVLEVHPPPRRDEAARIVADMLAGKQLSCPVPVQTKGGTLIPVDTKVVPGVWNDKPVLFGISRDITALTQSQEQLQTSLQEKEVLLKEIHHRVKNNLQIVSSLLYLQANQITDEATLSVLHESQNRVKSMALIHEQLYQSGNLARIDFASYVQTLTRHLFKTYQGQNSRISLSLEIDNLFLDVATAIPCGLIINELVSNALKHAFLPNQNGCITIQVRHDVSENQYTLLVRDDGRGVSDAMIRQVDQNGLVGLRQSLGLRLVDTLVSQLDGTLQLEQNNGAMFIIKFSP